MEPLTMMVSALVAGASAALTETASKVVKDAYQGVRGLLVGKCKQADLPLQLLEREATPESKELLRKELERGGLDKDPDLVGALHELAQAVKAHAPESAKAAGINVEDVIASGDVIMTRLRSSGELNVKRVKSGGDFVLSDVDTTNPKERGGPPRDR